MTNESVVFLGYGGHVRVLLDILKVNGFNLGRTLVCDPAFDNTGNTSGLECVQEDAALQSSINFKCIIGLASTKDVTLRQTLFEKCKYYGKEVLQVIHPSATIASDVRISEGVQVLAGVIIGPGSKIGRNVILNTRACIDHDCIIGDHSHIAPGVVLSGNVKVKSSCHVGTGSTVIQGITINERAFVAAGAVVIKDVETKQAVYGIPAQPKEKFL